MVRRHMLFALVAFFAVGTLSALAAEPKKPAPAPIIGNWAAAATVEKSGKETPFPNRPGDNPRVNLTLAFQTGGTFEMRAKSSYTPQPGQELPKELVKELNKTAVTRGKWSLAGDQLTIQPTSPQPGPKTTTQVRFQGASLFLQVPQVGYLRFERAR